MSEAEAGPAVHHADPAARRKLLLLAPAGVGLLLTVAWWFQGHLDNLSVETTEQLKESTFEVIDNFTHALYCSAVLLGLLAIYWLRLGRRIDVAPQYPLPQMRLFHDMRIVRGEAKRRLSRRARRSAAAALAGAAALLATAVVLPRRIASEHPILFQQAAPAVKLNGGAAAKLPKTS